MGHHHSPDHAHHHHGTGNIRIAFWLNTIFAVIELIGGLFTNSVAILSDALHDFGDSLSLGLAYYFERMSKQIHDDEYSYGYKRFSILGAFINAVVLLLGSVFIIREAIERLINPQEPNVKGMLIIAVVGIVFNGIALLRLRKGESVNERVVSLHFMEDVLGWVAVLIGSIVMLFVDVPVLDPILSILIAAYILFNIYRNLKQVLHIVLQGIPENIDIAAIRKRILGIPQIISVHDLHSWTMDGRYNVLTVHIVLKQDTTLTDTKRIKREIRNELQELNVHHVTVETELENDSCVLNEL